MSRSALARLVAVSVALAAAVRPAAAQDAPGDALTRARDAEARAHAGDYASAIVLFKQAYALDARAEYACNVGVAYYKARDLPRAQLFLDACLLSGADLPRDFVASVWRVLEAVETRLRQGDYAPIDLRVAPGTAEVRVSAFASDEIVLGARRIWLPVGHHQLVATAPGHVTRQFTVDVGNRQAQRVDIVLAADPPAPSQADTPPLAEAPPAPQPVVPAPWKAAAVYYPKAVNPQVQQPVRRSGGARSAATITTVITVVLFATSFAIYASADDDPDTDYYDESTQGEVLAITGFTATAALGITSMILWSRASANSRGLSAGASPTSGGGQVWLGGQF